MQQRNAGIYDMRVAAQATQHLACFASIGGFPENLPVKHDDRIGAERKGCWPPGGDVLRLTPSKRFCNSARIHVARYDLVDVTRIHVESHPDLLQQPAPSW
jgi:hypothetical protein